MRSITRVTSKHGKIWYNDNSLLKMTFISDFRLLTFKHKSHITDCKWNNIHASNRDLVSWSDKDPPPTAENTSGLKKDNDWPYRKLWLNYINIPINQVDWNIFCRTAEI